MNSKINRKIKFIIIYENYLYILSIYYYRNLNEKLFIKLEYTLY